MDILTGVRPCLAQPQTLTGYPHSFTIYKLVGIKDPCQTFIQHFIIYVKMNQSMHLSCVKMVFIFNKYYSNIHTILFSNKWRIIWSKYLMDTSVLQIETQSRSLKMFSIENFGHEWMKFKGPLLFTTKTDSLLLCGSQRNPDNLMMAWVILTTKRSLALRSQGSQGQNMWLGKCLRKTHTALSSPILKL